MKKILFLAFVLVVAVGMSAAAADISWSGGVETEAFQGVGDDDGAQGATYSVDLDLSVYVDEFSSLYFESETGDSTGDAEFSVGEAALVSDLGGWIGAFTGAPLGFGLHYKVGYAEWDYEDVADVSDYGNEGLAVGDFTAVGQRFGLTFVDMVNVYAAHSFVQAEGLELDDIEDGDTDPDGVTLAQMIFGADAAIPVEGIGTLGLEAVLSMFDATYGTGTIIGEAYGDPTTVWTTHLGLGASFAMDEIIPDLSGALGASFTYDLTDYGHDIVDTVQDVDEDLDDWIPLWYLGVGGSVSYLDGLVGASISFSMTEEYTWYVPGVDADDADDVTRMGLGLALTSSPIEFLSFEAGLGLGLDDDYYEEIMNSADISMTFSPGAASFTLGYFWKEEDAANVVGDLNAVTDDFTSIYFAAGLEY